MSDEVVERNTSRVRNRELLTNVFGYWPSFHDAEVLRIELSRGGPTLISDVYVFRMTSAVDANGYYVLDNQVIATLAFSNVVTLSLSAFNHQNVLMELSIVDVRSEQNEGINYQVQFSSSFGVEAEFRCGSIEVVSVTPYTPTASPTQLPLQSAARPVEFPPK